MEVLVTAEVVVGACLVAGLICIAFVFLRRRLIAREADLTLCALRPEGQPRWRAGLLRFDDVAIAWFPLLGLTLRPTYTWERHGLELGSFATLGPGEALDAGALRAQLRGTPVGRGVPGAELALAPDPYTALRAWVEATPPYRRPVDC